MLTQLPARVPWTQSRTWSIAAFAALAAEDSPRASMIAAPRFCTVGMKIFSSHSKSLIIGQTFWPPHSAWNTSGYCVAEWFPQIVTLRIELNGLPIFCAIWLMERLWFWRLITVHLTALQPGDLFMALRHGHF